MLNSVSRAYNRAATFARRATAATRSTQLLSEASSSGGGSGSMAGRLYGRQLTSASALWIYAHTPSARASASFPSRHRGLHQAPSSALGGTDRTPTTGARAYSTTSVAGVALSEACTAAGLSSCALELQYTDELGGAVYVCMSDRGGSGYCLAGADPDTGGWAIASESEYDFATGLSHLLCIAHLVALVCSSVRV